MLSAFKHTRVDGGRGRSKPGKRRTESAPPPSSSRYAPDAALKPTYATRGMTSEVPKYRMPDASMPGSVAAQIIRDELLLDGSPGLNVASFVNTFVEQDVKELIMDAMTKNAIDAGA